MPDWFQIPADPGRKYWVDADKIEYCLQVRDTDHRIVLCSRPAGDDEAIPRGVRTFDAVTEAETWLDGLEPVDAARLTAAKTAVTKANKQRAGGKKKAAKKKAAKKKAAG